MCFIKYFNCGRVGFQQFRAIQHFCVEGSNKRSDRGHSSNELEFFYKPHFQRVIFGFWQIDFTHFIFFLATMGEGASQVD